MGSYAVILSTQTNRKLNIVRCRTSFRVIYCLITEKTSIIYMTVSETNMSSVSKYSAVKGISKLLRTCGISVLQIDDFEKQKNIQKS